MADFKAFFDKYSHLEGWISTRDAIIATAILISATYGFLSQLPLENKWIPAISAIVVGVALLAGWYFAREKYWKRSQDSTSLRVAVSYNGFRTPIDEWIETRKKLNELFADKQLSKAVSLRLVDPGLVNEANWPAFREKYGFDLLLQIDKSPAEDDKPKTNARFSTLHDSTSDEVLAHNMQQVAIAMRRLLMPNATASSQLDLIHLTSVRLYRLILVNLAFYAEIKKHYSDASHLFHQLAIHLRASQPEDAALNHFVRSHDCYCLAFEAGFENNEIPNSLRLIEHSENLNTAIQRYGYEFPYVHIQQSRMLFFLNEHQKAIELLDNLLRNTQLKGLDYLHVRLNLGVLNLFINHYDKAAENLEYFLRNSLPEFKWLQIIQFADSAVIRIESAAYLQLLYRIHSQTAVSKAILEKGEEWVNADTCRNQLKKLLHLRPAITAQQRPAISLNQPIALPKPKSNSKRRSRRKNR